MKEPEEDSKVRIWRKGAFAWYHLQVKRILSTEGIRDYDSVTLQSVIPVKN